jgi:PBSX family phage terminase large subunit
MALAKFELSRKQLQVFYWPQYKRYRILVAVGAGRSGKSFCVYLSFVLNAMRNYRDCEFIIASQSYTSLKKYLVNKFRPYIEKEFKLKCRVNDKDRVMVLTGMINGELVSNTFYLNGGGKAGDEFQIQGCDARESLIDEATLVTEEVHDMIISRMGAHADTSRLWLSMNPAGKSHYIKTRYVDKAEERGDILLKTFYQEDNPSISKESLELNRKDLEGTGVFFKRFIEAEWADGTGPVYPNFNRELHVVPTEERDYTAYWITCDYGESNPACFSLWGYLPGHRDENGDVQPDRYYLVNTYYYENLKYGTRVYDDHYPELEKLAGNRPIEMVWVDPSATGFIEYIRRKGKFRVARADNEKTNGIRACATLINRTTFLFNDCNELALREFELYQRDPKSQNGDEVIDRDNHFCDTMRYLQNSHGIIRYEDAA